MEQNITNVRYPTKELQHYRPKTNKTGEGGKEVGGGNQRLKICIEDWPAKTNC